MAGDRSLGESGPYFQLLLYKSDLTSHILFLFTSDYNHIPIQSHGRNSHFKLQLQATVKVIFTVFFFFNINTITVTGKFMVTILERIKSILLVCSAEILSYSFRQKIEVKPVALIN